VELERGRKRTVHAVTDGQPRRTDATVLVVHLKTVSHRDGRGGGTGEDDVGVTGV
jgi:hypothetical protein